MSRWVSVVFLQGDEADQALRILDESGPADAVDYLTSGITATRPPWLR